MSNSEDQDTPVDAISKKETVLRQNPQEKKIDLQPRKVMVQTQRDFKIITEKEEYKWSLP